MNLSDLNERNFIRTLNKGIANAYGFAEALRRGDNVPTKDLVKLFESYAAVLTKLRERIKEDAQ
jgi:hypothetical protein